MYYKRIFVKDFEIKTWFLSYKLSGIFHSIFKSRKSQRISWSFNQSSHSWNIPTFLKLWLSESNFQWILIFTKFQITLSWIKFNFDSITRSVSSSEDNPSWVWSLPQLPSREVSKSLIDIRECFFTDLINTIFLNNPNLKIITLNNLNFPIIYAILLHHKISKWIFIWAIWCYHFNGWFRIFVITMISICRGTPIQVDEVFMTILGHSIRWISYEIYCL